MCSRGPKFETVQFRKLSEALVLNGGRYWDRTGGPCRVKRVVGAYRSTIWEPESQLQQALGITRCHAISRNVTFRSVPEMSHTERSQPAASDPSGRPSKSVVGRTQSVDPRNYGPSDPRQRHEENGTIRDGSSRHQPGSRPFVTDRRSAEGPTWRLRHQSRQ